MLQTIAKNHHIYAFDAKHAPAVFIKDGERIEVETADCFTDQINTADYVLDSLDWQRINPATGPIYIHGAQVGDILKVTIEKIDINTVATMLTGKDMGVLGDELTENTLKKYSIEDNHLIFSPEIKIPLNKMIGVIGTAPKAQVISCGTPDEHGGNMDCKEITEGTILLLPVAVEGALLALGDLHAAMGDGEVGVSGAEIAGRVRLKIDVIKGKNWPTPMLINQSKVMTIASKATLDEACIVATKAMVALMQAETKLSKEDCILLLSLQGDLRICQVVDPNKTVRMELERKYLPLEI